MNQLLTDEPGLSWSWRFYAGAVKTSRLEINNQLTLIVNHLSLADAAGVQAAVDRCSALTASLLAYSSSQGRTLSMALTSGPYYRSQT